MRHVNCLVFSLAIAVVLSVVGSANGKDAISAEIALLVPDRPGSLYEFHKSGLCATRTVTSTTLLVGTHDPEREQPAQLTSFRFVRSVRPGLNIEGWMDSKDLKRVDLGSTEAKALLTNAGEPRHGDLPEIIRLQKNSAVKEAWNQVVIAMQENKTLDTELPEPYFARAEIWFAVGNYEDALRDYLKAMQMARAAGHDPASYNACYDKLHDVLEHWDGLPKPPTTGAKDNLAQIASNHFSQGYSKYWKGDLVAAIRHFDNSIQLFPQDPVAWYYRAVAFKQQGDIVRAQHDACMAAFLEGKAEQKYRRQVGPSLERIQGDHRKWLEAFRLGDCTTSNYLLDRSVQR